MNNKFIAIVAAAAAAASFANAAQARDQVQVAGSSTVLPYANIVAEEFGKAYDKFKTPVVESGGSSAGLKQFCQGLGEKTIDVANSSRKIKDKEVKACGEAGVKEIMEVRFGYDGIVFATDAGADSWALEAKDVYLALADKIPQDGKLVDNPHKKWSDVNDKLPDWDIVAYIPGENHGTREVFETKVMEAGCKAAGGYDLHLTGDDKKAKKAASKACFKVRKDGGTEDITGDYTVTLGKLQSNKTGVGVFGLSFYENNTDKLKVATMSGIEPNVETISTGKYPVSRPLFFYVKKAHIGVIPGLKEYVEFFTSTKMIGPDGPLAEYGLVPMPKNELDELQKAVSELKTM